MSPAQFNEYQRQADVIEQHQKLQKEKELSNILNNMTAIDWLVKKVNSDCLNSTFIRKELIDEAKEMEKQQIIDAFWNGDNSDCTSEQNSKEFAEKYYNETYGSKGSDEHIVDTNEMVCYTKQDVIDAIIKIHEIYSLHGQYNDTLEAKKLRLKGVSWHIQNILESLKKKIPTSSQTEISDEEIMEAAYKYAEVYQCPTEIKMCKHDVISAWNKSIKWYREQLKSKQ